MSSPKQALQTRSSGNTAARLGTVGQRLGPTPRRITACLELLLQTTQEYGCSPTLAITARVLARHPAVGQMLVERGAEVAIYGYVHTNYALLSYEQQLEHVRQARETFDRLAIPHQGFRAPYQSWNSDTLRAVAAARLAYDSSSLVGWDVVDQEMALEKGWRWDEYQRVVALRQPQDAAQALSLPAWTCGIVEIPGSFPDDESLIDWLAVANPEDVAEIWLTALGQACRRDELLTLQLHQERVGFWRPALEAVLSRARAGRPAPWVATLSEIAGWWNERRDFRWQRIRGETGRYAARLLATPRASILFKGTPPPDMQTRPWAAGWRRVKGQVVSIPGGKRPVVGVPEKAPKALVAFLQSEGYIVEVGRRRGQAVFLEGYTRFRPQDVRHVLNEIDASPGPLVRFGRWPDGARGALAVTGALGAVTWWDFAWRLVES